MRAALSALSLFALLIHADEIPKKTLAVIYEEGKTPEALFHIASDNFKKLVQTGELKSAEFGSANIFGEVIDVQTATDSTTTAKRERDIAAIAVGNAIKAANIPYTGRFSILATNLLFGDKSLGYVINPYRGCYNHNYLAKGLEQAGFKIVEASENPDVTMTVGIDVCMTENEYKEYIQKNTALKIKNTKASVSTAANSSIGDDLMRSGSSVQLATPSGGGNTGVAIAGVGLALNMVNWMTTKAPQERDMIRYHVKFEGKDKQPLEFYPVIMTKDTHKEGDTVHIGSYHEAEGLLFTSFLAWNTADKQFSEKIPPLLLEKDLLKMTEAIVNLKK